MLLIMDTGKILYIGCDENADLYYSSIEGLVS